MPSSVAHAVATRSLPRYSNGYVRSGAAAASPSAARRSTPGANVENAAYPQGWCRRPAGSDVHGWRAHDGGRRTFTNRDGAIDVHVPRWHRRKYRRLAGTYAKICKIQASMKRHHHSCGPEGLRRSFTLEEVLPLSFGPLTPTLDRAVVHECRT